MSDPVGYFITWTCYGTWLYGDERGSVDRAHNAVDTPFLAANDRRVRALQRRMKYAPFRLTTEARAVVDQTIREHARLRGWEIIAVNVRSNHVHVVVRFANVAPEIMMGQWKAWCSRRLREGGMVPPGRPIWTRHGSTRYLWKLGELDPAFTYVAEGQDAARFTGSRKGRATVGSVPPPRETDRSEHQARAW